MRTRSHCYDNTAPNVKCQRVLVLAVCLDAGCGQCFDLHSVIDINSEGMGDDEDASPTILSGGNTCWEIPHI